jgi:hypothetical protein
MTCARNTAITGHAFDACLPLAALSEVCLEARNVQASPPWRRGEIAFGQAWFPSAKTDSAADPELDHPGMCVDLRKEPKAFDNPMVQVDELSLAQPVNISPFHSATVGCN